MAEPVKAAPVAIAVSIGLGVLALMFWVLALATLSDLASSDAAGNAYAQAYAAIDIFVLWGLLAVIAIIAWAKGVIAWPAALAAAILIPASGVVTLDVLELLSRPSLPPFLWPLVIPAAVPAARPGVQLLGAHPAAAHHHRAASGRRICLGCGPAAVPCHRAAAADAQ